jgi:hypothetical protein
MTMEARGIATIILTLFLLASLSKTAQSPMLI